MISTHMHRLADRLGVRDGEAYTIVSGLVVALLLATVGLPGVLRGFDATAVDQAAAASPSPSSTPTSVVSVSPPSTESVTTPSLPALAPGPLPSPSSPSAPAAAPTTTTRPGPGGGTRPMGDLALLADVPDPGSPGAVAVGADGTVYVVSDAAAGGSSSLWAFSVTGELRDTWTAPGQDGARTRGLTGVTVDPDGTVWVVDASTARLLRLDRTEDALIPVAEADDIPACGLLNLTSPCESGLVDSAPLLSGIVSAPDGTIVVADRGQGVLWRVDGSDLAVLTTIEDRLPGDGPIGVSFASDDELIVAVGARLTSFPPGLPAVVQIRLPGGRPDAPVLVADLAVTETPAGLVAGSSGRVYVAIPSVGVVADIGIDQGDRIDIVGGDGDPTFTGPLGLALRERSLLIADTTDRIFDLAVNDRPVSAR